MLHFIYFFSTNISTEYFKHAAQSPFFSSKCRLFYNATFFGSCFIHILHTGVLKFKCKTPLPKGWIKQPNRCTINLKFIVFLRIHRSTCFGHCCTHHQEPPPTVFEALVTLWLPGCRCLKLVNRPQLEARQTRQSYGNQRLQRQLEGLLIMGTTVHETCWTVSTYTALNMFRALLCPSSGAPPTTFAATFTSKPTAVRITSNTAIIR
jgi:hypothetical protein